jgi:hypothetical protein
MLAVCLDKLDGVQAENIERSLRLGMTLCEELPGAAKATALRVAVLHLAKPLLRTGRREEAEKELAILRDSGSLQPTGAGAGAGAHESIYGAHESIYGAHESYYTIGAHESYSLEDVDNLLAQLIVQRVERGYYFVCPNVHPYLIGECGGAMQQSKCPDCGEVVGGGNHALSAGNRRADERDGRGATAWDVAAPLVPNPALIERVARGDFDV